MADEEEPTKKTAARKTAAKKKSTPKKSPAKRGGKKASAERPEEVSGTPWRPEDLDDEDAAETGEELAVPDRVTAGRTAVSDEELTAIIDELQVNVRNKLIPGVLTVHYAGRDVNFPMDGDSAMRLLAVLAGTAETQTRFARTAPTPEPAGS